MNVIQGPLAVLGRLLLCTIFFTAAVLNKIPHFNGVAAGMEKMGIPFPQIALVGAIVFLIVGSVSIVLGYKARFGAVLLLVFLALATYYFHAFWKMDPHTEVELLAYQNQMAHFMKNVALMGTMLFIMAIGSGPMSLDSVCCKNKAASE